MQRTQIYLDENLINRLKLRARGAGMSVSELIRQTLKSQLARDPVSDARAYFDRLKPLESFADIDPQAYVRNLRGKSRLQNRES